MNGDMCSIEISTLNGYKTKNERKVMNDKFDELAKSMAQSVTRRGALKKFGLGLAGIALATLGLANRAEASGCKQLYEFCMRDSQCCSGRCYICSWGCKKGYCL